MAYARTNWTLDELLIALQNPVHAEAGPHAHSSKHAVQGELAGNALFQHARVTALVYDGRATDANASFHAQDASGNYLHSNNQRKKHPLPSPEAGAHSTLGDDRVATAVRTAFNHASLRTHLQKLDAGEDMKLFVNYTNPIGRGRVHTSATTTDTDFTCLFVYCKPNAHNRDVPIFQTVVPHGAHKVGGSDPIVTI